MSLLKKMERDCGKDVDYGVLYLCTGWRGALLRNSVASLRAANPELPFQVLADRPYDFPFQWVKSWTQAASRRIKTQLCRYSPYKITLFVDDDTVFAKRLDLEAMLGDADLAIGLDVLSNLKAAARMVRWPHHVTQDEVEQTVRIGGDGGPFYNTGVILWRDNAITRRFFDCWYAEWLKYQKCDQFAFVRALHTSELRFKLLEQTYNSAVYDQTCARDAHIYHLLQKQRVARRFALWNPPPAGPFEAAFEKAVSRGLMAENQYRWLARAIHSCRPCSLLVIGAGYDADLWYHCSDGNVAYVDDDPEFAATFPNGAIIHTFQSRVGRWCPVPDPPPPVAKPWDFVIVDGPKGRKQTGPGRQTPIAWAARLARKAVLVHDYERAWERQVCDRYLGAPDEVIDAEGRFDRKLAVFHRGQFTKGTVESNFKLAAAPTGRLRRGAAADQLGILFLHHDVDDVVLRNLRSIQEHNPEALVATMGAGKELAGGYTLAATPLLQRLHATAVDQSSDRMVCSWFLQRKESCDKWWIVEWDTFCTVAVRRYYAPVWHFPFVASTVCLLHRQPDWYWFRDVKKMPGEYRPYATGAVPFLYLVDQAVLEDVCTTLIENPLLAGNCELRFATAAHRCGYAPCGFSPPNDQITWLSGRSVVDPPGISHPVKQ